MKYGVSTRFGSGSRWAHGTVPGTQITGFRIDGIEEVTENINAALKEMQRSSAIGLTVAARWVLTDADTGRAPLVPERTGYLRRSTFTRAFKDELTGDPYVVLGYDAPYAAAVHEMMQSPSGMPINWRRPGSGPKFFEASLKRNAQAILDIVKKYVVL